jgi:hypothetical protein
MLIRKTLSARWWDLLPLWKKLHRHVRRMQAYTDYGDDFLGVVTPSHPEFEELKDNGLGIISPERDRNMNKSKLDASDLPESLADRLLG